MNWAIGASVLILLVIVALGFSFVSLFGESLTGFLAQGGSQEQGPPAPQDALQPSPRTGQTPGGPEPGSTQVPEPEETRTGNYRSSGSSGSSESGGDSPPGHPAQQVCTPGERQCSGDELQECPQDGMAWQTLESCSHGCDQASLRCKPSQSIVVDFSTGEAFNVSVEITTDAPVFAAQFSLRFNGSKLNANATEGGFLKQDGASTYCILMTDNTDGVVSYSCTRLGERTGVNGTGTLLQTVFAPEEDGSDAIYLEEIIIIEVAGDSIGVLPHEAYTLQLTPA